MGRIFWKYCARRRLVYKRRTSCSCHDNKVDKSQILS
jgi:hypothetical protein